MKRFGVKVLVGAALAVAAGGVACPACGNELPERLRPEQGEDKGEETAAAAERGEVVRPPFAMKGELEGLLLVWFDREGLHTAGKRSEIPEGRRKYVRVDSLRIAPERRLDPEHIYVADLRSPGQGGEYAVTRQTRVWFERLVDKETGAAAEARREAEERARAEAAAKAAGDGDEAAATGAAGADVVLYTASWCGACRAARTFLQKKKVPFVEKDIEKDRNAYAEMLRKAKQAGVKPGGLPFIDFRGRILTGFDQGTLQRLIAAGAPPG
jgi:glutaredoxin